MSITAEKIEEARRIAWLPLEERVDAILSLLHQQGEPEGWSSKTDHDKFSFRNGIRFAITWLHERAHSMNDPKAQTILNTAAFNLGTESSSAADKAMLSASPLPPAPGAETAEQEQDRFDADADSISAEVNHLPEIQSLPDLCSEDVWPHVERALVAVGRHFRGDKNNG